MPFVIIAFAIAAIGGWVANVVKMIGLLGDLSLTPIFVARVLGVPFGPLGAVLGYF